MSIESAVDGLAITAPVKSKSAETPSATPSSLTLETLPTDILYIFKEHVHIDDYLALKLTSRTFDALLCESLTAATQAAHGSVGPPYKEDFGRLWYAYTEPSHGASEEYWPEGRALTYARNSAKLQHARIEHALTCDGHGNNSTAHLERLLCTQCGRVRPRTCFTDGSAATALTLNSTDEGKTSDRYNRTCIECSILWGRQKPNRYDLSREAALSVSGKQVFACASCCKTWPLDERVFGSFCPCPRCWKVSRCKTCALAERKLIQMPRRDGLPGGAYAYTPTSWPTEKQGEWDC